MNSSEKVDYLLLAVILILVTLGLIMVWSSSYYTAYLTYEDGYYYFRRQAMWAAIGIFLMFFLSRIDYKFFKTLAPIFLAVAVFLLVFVLFKGEVINGAKRWIDFGFVSFQPSEVAKIALVFFLSLLLSKVGGRINEPKILLSSLLVVAVACFLIIKEPDLSTAVIAGTTFLVLVYVGGLKRIYLSLLVLGGGAATIYLALTANYRLERILVLRDPSADPLGAGYQILQSQLAFGSGQLFGLGLGNGMQKYLYLPERHTDFIFANIGEELGFIGAATVVILFLVLIWRGFRIAFAAKDSFGYFLAIGLTAMIGIQAFVNMGAVLGLLPVTGVPLPLVSYGGSSLVFTLSSLGVLLNISRNTVIKEAEL